MISDQIKIAFLDLDGTVHDGETVWEIIHKLYGTWESFGLKYLDQYLKHEISFERFAELDVACWQGIPEALFREGIDRVRLFPEIERFFEICRDRNISVYFVSNGIYQLGKRLIETKGLTGGCVANEIEIKNGQLTGKINFKVMFHEKGKIVSEILQKYGYAFEEATAIGDGENDRTMFERVKYPIYLDHKNRGLEGFTGFSARSWKEILAYLWKED